jgi:MerR family transcriptional regulator, light-induced transcriptional regulator
MPTTYSIKDLERLSGIKAHTLRIWEQRYNILRPGRTETNIRLYSNSDLRRVLNISLLNNNGYRISNIAKLEDDKLLHEVEKLLSSFSRESDQVDNLLICLMDLDEERFEKVITNCIAHFGFENTYEKVIFPFLKEVGNKWQLGIITPAQEHYMSNLVRQKLIAGIDRLSVLANPRAKTVLFFLPGDELHELGLLYTHYLTRLMGHRCLYLGQCVPADDLLQVGESARPDLAVTILTASPEAGTLDELLHDLDQKLPQCRFLLSGRVFYSDPAGYRLPSDRFTLFEDFTQFKALLAQATT